MGPEEARAAYEEKYGAVSDEDWAELSADVTDWDAFLAAKADQDSPPPPPAEPDPPADPPCDHAPPPDAPAPGMMSDFQASMATELEAMRVLLTSQGEIIASMQEDRAADKAALRKAQFTGEIAAAMFDVGGRQHRAASSAIEVLAAIAERPGEMEPLADLLEHLKMNGGKLCTVPVEIAAAIDPDSPGTPPDPDAALLADLAGAPEAIAAIKDLAARENIPVAQARSKYLLSQTGL